MNAEIERAGDMAERLHPLPTVLDSDTARGDRRVHLVALAAIRADREQVVKALLAEAADHDAAQILAAQADDSPSRVWHGDARDALRSFADLLRATL